MAEAELKSALHREGEARIRGFWETAEGTVSAQRAEFEAELAQLRAETDRQLQADSTELRNTLLLAARTRAMASRLHAEAALEKRLLILAGELLRELAERRRASVWEALCAELPNADWLALRVHPEDCDLAAAAFPAATIETDTALGGGLIVANADGTMRIDNSLACRLLRGWPDLLPQLVGELRTLVDTHETADADNPG